MKTETTLINSILRFKTVRALIVILCLGSVIPGTAQFIGFIPNDHKGEAPSSSIAYMPNLGQLRSLQGTSVPNVAFYSVQTAPQMFFSKDNTIHFSLGLRDTTVATPDTVYRISVRFAGESSASCIPVADEATEDSYNFILGHCPNGIFGVRPSKRIVYKDIYPYIDLHIYSNAWGPKMYLVMRPGSDPALIKMRFEGQDALLTDLLGNLVAIKENKAVLLPKGLCYQQIGNTTQLISAGLDYELYEGGGTVSFDFQPYNPDYPLIIDISASMAGGGGQGGDAPEWSTFYGHTETDYASDGLALPNGGLLVCGTTTSPEFPLFFQQDGNFDGGQEAYYSEFDQDYRRLYTTFFGGNGVEAGESIALTTDNQSVYLYGRTSSTNLPTLAFTTGFYDDTADGGSAGSNCYVARFSRATGTLGQREWVTYFGDGLWVCSCLRVDAQDQVHILGTTDPFTPPVPQTTCQGTYGTFPACNTLGNDDYFKGTTAGGSDAFYATFDAQLNLRHSTFFGGSGTDQGADMVVDNAQSRVYIVGNTSSRRQAYTNCQPPPGGGFPLCDQAGSYFQDDLNVNNTDAMNDAYIAAFDFNGGLRWSTFVGSSSDEVGFEIGRSSAGDIYMSGITSATGYAAVQCGLPTGPGFPNCAASSQLRLERGTGAIAGYLIKFNSAGALEWTTFVNGTGGSFVPTEGDGVLFTLNTQMGSGGLPAYPVQAFPNRYFQPTHADGPSLGNDIMVMELSGQEEILYSTYYGGVGSDGGRVAFWVGGRLYLYGSSGSLSGFPFHCPPTQDPYCYLSYVTQSATTGEAFYAQLQYDVTIGLNEPATSTTSTAVIYPNPTRGEIFIRLGNEPMQGGKPVATIFDATGRLVWTQALVTQQGALYRLDVGHLERGMYWLQVNSHTGGVGITHPFIVE